MFARSGAPRLAYLHDCLESLDAALRERFGVELHICHGDPVDVVPRLAADIGADAVFVTRDYTPYGRRRDQQVIDGLMSGDRSLVGVGSPYAVAPGTVAKADGQPYAVFTPFSKVWRQTGWGAPSGEPADDFRWVSAAALGISSRPAPRTTRPGL